MGILWDIIHMYNCMTILHIIYIYTVNSVIIVTIIVVMFIAIITGYYHYSYICRYKFEVLVVF